MTCAAGHAAEGKTQLPGSFHQPFFGLRRHTDGRYIVDLFLPAVDPAELADAFHCPQQVPLHTVQAFLLDPAHIDADGDFARDHVHDVRGVVEDAHSGHTVVGSFPVADALDLQNDGRGGAEGVVPHGHGCRAGMVRHAVQIHTVALRPGDGADDADLRLCFVQNLSLLDMHLQVFSDAGDLFRVEGPALFAKDLRDGAPVLTFQGINVFLVAFVGNEAASDGAETEVRGFLASESADPERDSETVPSGPAETHETRDHTGRAVILTALDDGIQVGSNEAVAVGGIVHEVGIPGFVLDIAAAQFLRIGSKDRMHAVFGVCIAEAGHTAAGEFADLRKSAEGRRDEMQILSRVFHGDSPAPETWRQTASAASMPVRSGLRSCISSGYPRDGARASRCADPDRPYRPRG